MKKLFWYCVLFLLDIGIVLLLKRDWKTERAESIRRLNNVFDKSN